MVVGSRRRTIPEHRKGKQTDAHFQTQRPYVVAIVVLLLVRVGEVGLVQVLVPALPARGALLLSFRPLAGSRPRLRLPQLAFLFLAPDHFKITTQNVTLCCLGQYCAFKASLLLHYFIAIFKKWRVIS